jgi:hypothetical protein
MRRCFQHKFTGMRWIDLSDKEVAQVAQAVRTALCDNKWQEWTDPVQPRFFNAIFSGLFNYRTDFWTPATSAAPESLASSLSEPARRMAIELMVAGELLCRPIPADVHASVERWASAFHINGDELTLVRKTANGAYLQAQSDLYRHGYWGAYAEEIGSDKRLVEEFGTVAYAMTVTLDPALAQRWKDLEHCAEGSLGRCVWEFYRLHDFELPGEERGANLITAQHDWIHVLADYSATGLGEIETAAFRITSTRLPGTLMTFLGELGFWHSGMVGSVLSGWHQAYSLDAKEAPESVAEAFHRGKACQRDLYLETDFFEFKDRNLEELRREWNIPPKRCTLSPGWRTRTRLTAADGESDQPPVFEGG